MTGWENISVHNGWGIAALGIIIVFFGLVCLSIVISQLHRIFDLINGGWAFPDRKKKDRQPSPPGQSAPPPEPETSVNAKLEAAVKYYRMLTQRMGEPFPLPHLIDIAEKRGLERPYSTINQLIISEMIIPDGNGYFIWKS